MTISGKSVLREIEGDIRKLENQSGELETELCKYETKLTELSEEREQHLIGLAKTYLPDLDAASVQQTLSEVKESVKQIFREKQEGRKELDELIRTSKQEREETEKQLESVTEKLNQKAAERDELMASVNQALKKNPDYVELDKKTGQASEIFTRHQQRLKEAKEEAKDKLPDYTRDKLFMYLVNRDFGTPKYQRKRLVGMLDSWIAKKVEFEKAKRNYDFLRVMPELMRIKVDEEQRELNDVTEKMQKIEEKVSEEYGLLKVIEGGTELGRKREQFIAKVKQEDSQCSEYTKRRKELDSAKDPYHLEAIQTLKDFLKGETIAELKQKAKSTPGTEDDKIASRLETIDLEVRELKDKAKDAKVKRDSVEDKLNGIKTIKGDFVSNDYDSSRSYFDSDFNISLLIAAYLTREDRTVHTVNKSIKASQHFKPKETYHSSSDYSYSGSSGHSHSDYSGSSYHSSGGGFGGGSFHSGGGFGGGGFSSGRGF